MTTPIADFVRRYAEGQPVRMHMPGHKGEGPSSLPFSLDITELSGADSLYDACGIIAESEKNASDLFGCRTIYSTEGSSLSIRAMLALAAERAPKGERPLLLAGRNAHRTLLSAAALLDFDIEWLWGEHYLSTRVTPNALEAALSAAARRPFAVYLTSPDYLGGITDIAGCSEVCHAHGVLLLVDNAHGAYLKFLPTSQHPMDLGADLCCDSAHKTLPVLTGGGYLHASHRLSWLTSEEMKRAMALFGSTSPSYLILQSLDIANWRLASDWKESLLASLSLFHSYKEKLRSLGMPVLGDEPMKWTLSPKAYGYTGYELAAHLERAGIFPEFADPDFTVLMLSPTVGEDALARTVNTIARLERRMPVTVAPPALPKPAAVCSVRTAMLSQKRTLPCRDAVGRVLADATVSCPPAVPIVAAGERIPKEAVAVFDYYGIKTCTVVDDEK